MAEPFAKLAPDQRRRAFGRLVADQYDRPTPQDTTVVERARLLPLGTYANGMTGLAFPGFIADPVAGFVREATNPVPYLNRSDDEKRQAVETGFDVAGAAMVGGLAAPKPNNTVGMFGGRLAKTADHAKLKRAETMEKDGFSRNDIRTQTGWFRDPGGNWRFEIDDSKAVYKPGTGTLGNVLQHDALYDAYPQLRNLPVGDNVNKLANGQYLPKRNGAIAGFMERFTGPSARIDMSPSAGRSSILHETQHAVDDIEGALRFADPSNPYGTSGPVTDRSAAYRDAPFEQSARGTQARADLTSAEREARAPWMDYSGRPAPRSTSPEATPAAPIAQRSGIPVLPERQAMEDIIRAYYGDSVYDTKTNSLGQRLNGGLSFGDSIIEGHKGSKNAAGDFYNATGRFMRDAMAERAAREGPASQFENYGKIADAYQAKAQLIGHNGGPAPSTWEDPFIYSLKDNGGKSGAAAGASLNALLDRMQSPSSGPVTEALSRFVSGTPEPIIWYRGSATSGNTFKDRNHVAGAALQDPNDPSLNELLRLYGIDLPRRTWSNAMLPGDA